MNFGYDELGRPLSSSAAHQGNGAHTDNEEEGHLVKSPQRRQPNVLDDSDSDFSDDVEIIDGQEATEDITKPIVAPSQHTNGSDLFSGLLIEDKRAAKDASVQGFVDLIASIPQRQRSIAVIGALHHGKTSLMAMLGSKDGVTVPYQQRKDERTRRLTLKTNFATVVLSGSSLGATSSSLVTLVDTPGHPSLAAELAAGVRLADSALLCVDAAEGVVGHTIHAIRVASLEGLPIALIITKIDRLMLDLRLPPMDMYRKLKGIVDTVNNHVAAMGSKSFVTPIAGTVMFSSCKLNLFFSLETFAQRYVAQSSSRRVSPCALAKKLWGNFTFSAETKSFVKLTAPSGQPPSFVSFVLEPIYKIVGHAATGSAHAKLSEALSQRPKGPLAAMIEAVRHYFGDAHNEAVSAVLNCVPQSTKRMSDLLARSRGTEVNGAVAVCPMQRVQTDVLSYHVIRVIKGVLRASCACAVMDERLGLDEPYVLSTFTELFIKTPEGLVEVKAAYVGQVVFASCGSGPDRSTGNAVLFQSEDGVINEERDDCYEALNDLIVLPLQCDTPRVLVTIEPVEPRHAATLRSGMQKLARTSPGLDIRAEETGEFTICGFGEVQLDAALNELRSLYCKDVPIKLSAPFVAFAETVGAQRGLLAVVGGGGSVSGHAPHMVGVVAGALQPELVHQIESGAIDPVPPTAAQQQVLQKTLRDVFRWDILEAQRIMACGPEASKGTNLLINDLVEEEDLASGATSTHHGVQSSQQRNAIVQGFRNAIRAGPLCGEPMRQIKASLTTLSTPASTAGASSSSSRAIEAQTAIHMRQAVTQALFGARLQLMEPVYAVELLAVPWRMDAVREILQMRRGIVLSEVPIPATPLNLVKATMPMMDSFGFETQLRMTTVGEVFCSMSFDRWDIVPGDPLDDAEVLDPLEPARGFQLARDFVLKTRYRKGLSSDIAIPL